MELGGAWLAVEADEDLRRVFPEADVDERRWLPVDVPGHWSSVPGLDASDGPVLYRRHFDGFATETGRRAFLTFDGIFYQADVWLDGAYLGDTEGYFSPHTFEVTAAMAERSEHVLAVEVTCDRPEDVRAKRNLTGIFQHWDCIDPSWNPGGIWSPVRLHRSGTARLATLRVRCRDATPEVALLDFDAVLDTTEATGAVVTTIVRPDAGVGGGTEHVEEHALSVGANRVRWRVTIEGPELWWPHALGAQPLYRVEVRVGQAGRDPAQPSDHRVVTTGLRQVRMHRFVTSVNGERLYLKGTNLGPTRRALAEATPAQVEADVSLARQAGLDLLRVHAHVSRPELYRAADRQGMLVWQDLPLQWGYGQVRRQAVRQARQAVDLLGHHPSVAVWCGHNEPWEGGSQARVAARQLLPGWNRTVLDRSIRRALERADPSRPVVPHSGVLPHPAGGTDTHLYCGWYRGDERDLPAALARLPVLARFVSEFGAQAVPATAGFMDPEQWPDLDWDRLSAHHGLQRDIFEQRVPPGDHDSFDSWREATQAYQATVIRHHIETLRRLKYRPCGGFCQFLLADAQPAVTWSVLDDQRVPKSGYHALAAACAPVIVVADRLAASYRPGERVDVAVHAVSDRRSPLRDVIATAVLAWPGGRRSWRYSGNVAADSCVRICRVTHALPAGSPPGSLSLDLELAWEGAEPVRNHYASTITAPAPPPPRGGAWRGGAWRGGAWRGGAWRGPAHGGSVSWSWRDAAHPVEVPKRPLRW